MGLQQGYIFLNTSKEHGHVSVMAASMHLPRVRALEVYIHCLLHAHSPIVRCSLLEYQDKLSSHPQAKEMTQHGQMAEI